MSARKSIFRGAKPPPLAVGAVVGHAKEEKLEEAMDTHGSIGGIALDAVPEAIAHMSPSSLQSFLERLKDGDDDTEAKRDHHDDLFSQVVALCARHKDHGRQAIANLLPFLGEYGHPELACFGIHTAGGGAGEEDEKKKKENEVASFLLGKEITSDMSGAWNVACAVDASGSMDSVADLIETLISDMSFIPIWSSFGSKQVDIDPTPRAAQTMGVVTGTKACSKRHITAKPHSFEAKCQRFSALHGVSHQHMQEMVHYREQDGHGFASSLFCYQTYVANLFNLAWAMHHRGQPYALVVIGDGEFDDMELLPQKLAEHKKAFALCRKLIFVAAPHIVQYTVNQLSDMFGSFVGTTEGCVFTMLQPPSRDTAGMHELAQNVYQATKAARHMEHLPGYQILVSSDSNAGPIYIPSGADRRGLIRMMEYQPAMAWRLARLIISVIAERATAHRVLEDALFSKLYGALIALRYNEESDELRHVCEWVKAELSRVKVTILDQIKNTPAWDESQVFYVIHRDLVDKLIDDSKKDPEAATKVAAELNEIVAEERGQNQIRYLCIIKSLSRDTIKQAVRQLGGEDGRAEEELLAVLKNLYTSDTEPEAEVGSSAVSAVPFVLERPRSVTLALSLMFHLYEGFDDILVKGRPLLLMCLRYCYDLCPASVENRDGVDPTMISLSREFLRHFTNYAVLGLGKTESGENGEAGEWEIKEFFDYMMNPFIMRLLLRAHSDFGIIPCAELVDILRNFYRARALLDLLNGQQDKRAIVLEVPVKVAPPGAAGFTFRVEEYLPTDSSDPKIARMQTPISHVPRRRKWRVNMTYDAYMDSMGVPVEQRKALKSFIPDEFCAAPNYRLAIEHHTKMGSRQNGGIHAMLDSLLGVSLCMHSDGTIECTSCAWTDVSFQRRDDEDWKTYWRRNQKALTRTLKLQHKAVLHKMRADDVRREWKQRGWVAVALDGFPLEAKLAYPVYSNGVPLPNDTATILPQSLVMPAAEFHRRFAMSSSGATVLQTDAYDLPVSWRTLLSTEGIPAALGLNPHVIELLLDKNRVNGTKLKFELAPELMDCYESAFDQPADNCDWDIPCEENYYTHLYNVRVKGHCRLALQGSEFAKIRRELWDRLEKFMRVKLSLRDVQDENAVATCWICAEEQRVGAKDHWLDLKGCCGQALCISCFDRSTRIDALPLRLFPKCPFCSSAIELELLEQFPADQPNGREDDIAEEAEEGNQVVFVNRGQQLEWLQQHVRRDRDELYTVAEARQASRNHNFSLCGRCRHVIPTRRNCAARPDDLPNVCGPCVVPDIAAPNDVKVCPSCGAHISRIDGCNDVRCICGQHICWICGGGVIDHDQAHFVDGYFASTCVNARQQRSGRRRRRRRG